MEDILYAVVIMLLVGRSFGILATRIGINSLVGEVLAGALIGPVALFLSHSHYGLMPNPTLGVIAEVGMLMLMLLSGLTTDFNAFKRERVTSIAIGGGGVLVSFALILGSTLFIFHFTLTSSLFIAAILSNTAIEICSRLLIDEGNVRLKAVVVGASFVDDIIAVYMIGIVSSFVFSGAIPPMQDILLLSIKVGFFLFITLAVGDQIFGHIASRIEMPREKVVLTFALVTMFILAILSRQIGLHEVIGAYIAGLIVGKWYSRPDPLLKKAIAHRKILEDIDAPLRAIFAPLFFVYIGISLPTMRESDIYIIGLLVLVLTVLAFAGKIIGCGLTARAFSFTGAESMLIGVSMGGRGAMELVLLNFGLTSGILTEEMFLALVGVTLATIILTPVAYIMVKRRYGI